MRKVLIVDDDPSISELLRLYFEKDGFSVFSCFDGEAVMQICQEENPDVIILDLMLPGKNGYDVLRELRPSFSMPILMLTARGDTLDKVVGLELGADDYIEKPFEPQELLARVKAVLRRTEKPIEKKEEDTEEKNNIVKCGHLMVDKLRYSVTINELEIDMPPKELELLFFLVTHPNRVYNREQLLENIWGFDFYGESRTVDVHIKRIREKLEPYIEDGIWNIKTVWGVGYKFEKFI